MNIKKVFNYIGLMMIMEAILMLLPFICSIVYKEKTGIYFLYVAIALFLIGIILYKMFTFDKSFYVAEGFVTASIGWIVLSIFGALPFYFSKEIPSLIDAIFETVSGFTTTGATILTDVTLLSKCMNFWRCFTHFIGGMGILVLMLAIIPTQSENMQIMKAESPGPQVGKLMPKVSDTAKTLYIIYSALTIITILSYIFSGMPIYDSICIGLGTAGTGGFVVTKNGCADYSYFSQTLISIFMLIFGVNFNIYYLLIKKKIYDAINSEELHIYLLIILFSILAISINIFSFFHEPSNSSNLYSSYTSLHHSIFQVSSIITTTGFTTMNFDMWPMFSKTILLLLMIVGGCAGSTAGGFKISRIIIIFKSVIKEIYLQLHPNSVSIVKYENKTISNDVLRTIHSYTAIYITFIIVGIILISFENFDFQTTVSSVLETFNNIGVGLSKVGPTGNFSIFSSFSKIVFILLMLTGRLEIFPIIMLFSSKTWRREQ